MVQTSGGVQSVTNSDGTITASPTTGNVVVSVGTLAAGSITDTPISASAAIQLSKLQAGTLTEFDALGTYSNATTNGKMAGFGATAAYTPTKTGKCILVYECLADNNTVGDGVQVDCRYGTGTAPVAGAAPTGTLIKGINWQMTSLGASAKQKFCLVVVLALTVSTAYWFDYAVNALTAGTAEITSSLISIYESLT